MGGISSFSGRHFFSSFFVFKSKNRTQKLGTQKEAPRSVLLIFYAISISTTKRQAVVVVVVVVVVTLTRIIKSVVTGQAPVTLELRNTPGKNTIKPKVVHAHVTADAIHASIRNI